MNFLTLAILCLTTSVIASPTPDPARANKCPKNPVKHCTQATTRLGCSCILAAEGRQIVGDCAFDLANGGVSYQLALVAVEPDGP